MGRSALIVFLCAGTAGGQSFPGHPPNLLAYCDQAIATARSESIVPPVALMQCGRPEYTEEARIAHLAGIVTLSLTIDDEGVPNEIRVVSPLGLGLDENAVACVRQSRYSAAQKDGKPVPLKTTVSLAFEEHWDSDWHLGAAAFQTAEGAARPVVIKAKYPGATGDHRNLTVCLRLTVGKDGIPRDIQVHTPQDGRLDKEAMEIVRAWRFRPGTHDRQSVDVPATLTLVHGVAARTMASSHRLP
jgi:TonB family protein